MSLPRQRYAPLYWPKPVRMVHIGGGEGFAFYKLNVAFTVLNAPAVLQFPGKQCTGFSAFHNIIERLGPFPVGNDRVDSV